MTWWAVAFWFLFYAGVWKLSDWAPWGLIEFLEKKRIELEKELEHLQG